MWIERAQLTDSQGKYLDLPRVEAQKEQDIRIPLRPDLRRPLHQEA